MTKHTAGPWRVNGNAIESRRKPTDFIAHVADESDNGCCEWEANTRLIAAAPELLAALKRALKLLDGSPYNYPHSDKTAFEAAIARAEGREETPYFKTTAHAHLEPTREQQKMIEGDFVSGPPPEFRRPK